LEGDFLLAVIRSRSAVKCHQPFTFPRLITVENTPQARPEIHDFFTPLAKPYLGITSE
jgi:hypothetical protein